MKLKQICSVLSITALTFMVACKPKDAEIQKHATEMLQTIPGVRAEVKDGVLTLTGTVNDETAKAAAEAAVKDAKGVKSVQNNITVAAPVVAVPAVTVTADDALATAVKDAVKDFPEITATVTNGVISVNGQVSAAKWRTLKMALDALHPQKVDAKGLTVK